MTDIIKALIDALGQHNIFALIFILTIAAVGYGLWKVINWAMNLAENHLNTIVESNKKFADSSEEMARLIDVIAEQSKATTDQLVFLKKIVSKQSYIHKELTNILLILDFTSNPEVKVRLENVIRKIEEPIE